MQIEDPEELNLIFQHRDGYRGVFWHKDDFEQQALLNEEWKNEDLTGEEEQLYERTKFQEALETMILKHDATVGINWDVIDYYLETYCRKDKHEEQE